MTGVLNWLLKEGGVWGVAGAVAIVLMPIISKWIYVLIKKRERIEELKAREEAEIRKAHIQMIQGAMTGQREQTAAIVDELKIQRESNNRFEAKAIEGLHAAQTAYENGFARGDRAHESMAAAQAHMANVLAEIKGAIT